MSLLAGLMMAGPIAAVFMVILSKTIPGQNIVFGVLYPLVVGALPTVLGTFGGGAASAIAGAVKTGVASLVGAVASRGTQATTKSTGTGSAPSGVVELNTPRTTVATKAPEAAPGVKAITTRVRPGPIITPATVKKAIQEARMKGAVAETLAEVREIGPGITFALQGPEAYKRHAEELAKEPEIRPKWEAFKARIKTLGGEAGRRAWTSIKALARGTKEAFKYQVGREFNIELGHLSIHGFRSGGEAEHGDRA